MAASPLALVPGIGGVVETVVSTDPLEVRMTLSVDGGQLDLLIDEGVNMVGATEGISIRSHQYSLKFHRGQSLGLYPRPRWAPAHSYQQPA